ncbi:MAG TPA: AI-2E family transporter [Thermomicrobiales bacterium]|jgi:predicted PurR-regulated permease PerM
MRSLLSIVALGLALWLTTKIWTILLLIIIALVLAGTFSPLVAWLERRRVPRALGLGLILLGLIGSVVGLVALIVPAFIVQVDSVVQSAPELRRQLADLIVRVPLLSGSAQQILETEPSGVINTFGERALTYAGTAVQSLVYGLVTVVLAFYLLADHERVQGFFFALLPRHYHLRSARVLLDMETIVGGYVRGQLLTSFMIGAVTFITLVVAGVPNAFALAVFAAAVDLIPLVGAVLAVIVPTIASFSSGPTVIIGVFITLFIYNQIENHIVIPRVYGQTMRLSPVAVLVALLIGGQLLGLIGALLALPIAAGIRVLVEDLRISLPGEQPGEATERATDREAEARYQTETAGASAVESAVLATAIAEQQQQEEQLAVGQVETPVEERGDDGAFEGRDGSAPASLPNPAR